MTEEIAVRIAEALESINGSLGLLTAVLSFSLGLAILIYSITKSR